MAISFQRIKDLLASGRGIDYILGRLGYTSLSLQEIDQSSSHNAVLKGVLPSSFDGQAVELHQ
jgi:hypothetical protein